MGTLETPIKPTSVGGFGCIHCRFWEQYEPDSYVQEQLGLVGKWGKCINEHVIAQPHSVREKAKNKQNMDISDIAGLFTLISTTDSYECPYYRMKTKDMKK